VDFSAFLVLPVSALLSFATLVVAARNERPRPRLVWPWAFSTVAAAVVFLRFPGLDMLAMWLFALFGIAFSAALGTVAGGLAARAISRR
jgi:hypothetical protein